MHLIKVSAINSTNSFAREMFKENPHMPATCIVADRQLEGRGQRGTIWESKPGQNLTFTVVFPRPGFSISHQFLLSAVVATSIVGSLKKLNIPKLKVKWPNDIMSAGLKIGGILIENVITENRVGATVIGIGLNVNQTDFKGLPLAGSLRTVTGQSYDRDEVLNVILGDLEKELPGMGDLHAEEILERYKKHLFRIHIPSTFQLPDQSLFPGIIEDVSLSGKLVVRREDGSREYDLKEIKLCF